MKDRFANSSICYDERHPILLRSDTISYFTTLIVRNSHQKVLHHGIETKLNHIRSIFWITKGRKTVKDILKKCVTCKHCQGRAMTPPVSPDLPSYRIDSLLSFKTTELDYTGPLYVTTYEKDAVLKVYILLLTYASSRAIILELTPYMQVPSFIRSFKILCREEVYQTLSLAINLKIFSQLRLKGSCYNIKLFRNSFHLPHLGDFMNGLSGLKKRPGRKYSKNRFYLMMS